MSGHAFAMSRLIQQLLGRKLAALYGSLPPTAPEPRLAALIQQLDDRQRRAMSDEPEALTLSTATNHRAMKRDW